MKLNELCLHPLFGVPTVGRLLVGVLGSCLPQLRLALAFALETTDERGCGGDWSQRGVCVCVHPCLCPRLCAQEVTFECPLVAKSTSLLCCCGGLGTSCHRASQCACTSPHASSDHPISDFLPLCLVIYNDQTSKLLPEPSCYAPVWLPRSGCLEKSHT